MSPHVHSWLQWVTSLMCVSSPGVLTFPIQAAFSAEPDEHLSSRTWVLGKVK